MTTRFVHGGNVYVENFRRASGNVPPHADCPDFTCTKITFVALTASKSLAN